MATILITGGTGRIGSECVRLLASHPELPHIRVATRSPDGPQATALRQLAPGRVHPVAFDDTDPDSLRRAAEGTDGLMLIAPFTPDMPGWHQRVLEAVKAVASPFVVKVSVTGAREPEGEPKAIPERHGASERVLRDCGLRHACIRPTIFAQHFKMSPALYQPGADRFFLPTGDTKVAFLDCRDIASMGMALLTRTRAEQAAYDGGAWELTGASAVSGADIAALLTALTRRPVTHVDGEEAFVAQAAALGVPDGIKGIYREAAEGWFSTVQTGPFTSLVGRSQRTFAHFAMDHIDHFLPR